MDPAVGHPSKLAKTNKHLFSYRVLPVYINVDTSSILYIDDESTSQQKKKKNKKKAIVSVV